MSDNKIDRLNTLVELIRLRSADGRRRAVGSSGANRQTIDGPDVSGQTLKSRDIEALRTRLGSQLKDLQDGSPEGMRRSSHVVVREILLWEFGQGLEKHAEFDSILATLDTAFAENPTLSQKMAALVEELQR